MDRPETILILCTGNSARSQMAEGILRHICNDAYEILSAGTKPDRVRPEAIKVLAELGIDITAHRAKSVNELEGRQIDHVLTVCDNAKETCPYFPAGTRLVHKGFHDPAQATGNEAKRLQTFRKVRDELMKYLPEFLSEIKGEAK